ncbi:NAD(P)/FAD-dependent oxidoreductase [Sphingobium sp.]|uniref:phytoene desaturase family protein n=1 Tax=Sphingobium sp. TaxID=1912891 RepID=UPI0028BE38DC|nr:NAD(P)/FAD-dependent oxidoreductase [Sphingobium sp.]
MTQFDVVIVGAGHNTLSCAAYLARAGIGVLVLEQHDRPGGGGITREATLPGFRHNIHAQVPGILHGSPILTHDELELKSKYGLKMASGELTCLTMFDDGDTLSFFVDLDRTCASIAAMSEKDAAAYRRLALRMRAIMPLMGMGMGRPPGSFGAFISLMEQMPLGADFIVSMMKSSYDLIVENFEHPKVIMHMMKWVGDAGVVPESKGTGNSLMFLIGATHLAEVGPAIGGTQAIADALIRCIEDHGSEIRTGVRVRRIVNSGGSARAVETDDGEIIAARKAVVAGIPPHRLGEMVEGLDPALTQAAERTHSSDIADLTIHLALGDKVEWHGGAAINQCQHFYLIDRAEMHDYRKSFDDLRYGMLPRLFSGAGVIPTNFDPGMAPDGKHVAFFYFGVPYALKDTGPEGWDAIKEEMADRYMTSLSRFAANLEGANVLARYVESPLDMARYSPSFRNGDVFGMGNYVYQSLGMRPTPQLSGYRVPGADGLYLSGPFMHPGGGINGGGRAVAIRVMEDLGVDTMKVLKV